MLSSPDTCLAHAPGRDGTDCALAWELFRAGDTFPLAGIPLQAGAWKSAAEAGGVVSPWDFFCVVLLFVTDSCFIGEFFMPIRIRRHDKS